MRKKKSKVPPEHAFGPSFGKWLNRLENYEDFVEGRINDAKVVWPFYNTNLFSIDKDGMEEAHVSADTLPSSFAKKSPSVSSYMKLVEIWAGNAANLRNSFKFKFKETGYVRFLNNYKSRLEITTYLPFENVYIQYDCNDEVYGDDADQVLMLCERRTLERDYPELALSEGETFICLTPAHQSPPTGLDMYPAEIHIREGVEWFAEYSEYKPEKREGSDYLWGDFDITWMSEACPDEIPPYVEAFPKGIDGSKWTNAKQTPRYANAFFAFLAMLSAGGIKETTVGKVKPENVIRRKPAHKKKHPMYEYKVLEIGVGCEPPIVDPQIPREYTKRRLHAVRGFWRTYKKPLKSGPNKGKTKVFVEGHWRGDKELGVIKKDYVFTTDEDKE